MSHESVLESVFSAYTVSTTGSKPELTSDFKLAVSYWQSNEKCIRRTDAQKLVVGSPESLDGLAASAKLASTSKS